MTLQSSSLPHTAIIATDTSIKNNIATSISHVHICDHSLTKMVSQIRYLLVVILELNSVSEVQYKDVMMIDDGKYQ